MTEKNRGDGRIRVGLVILELSRGGAEKAFFELATRLDRRRFDVVVYTISGRARDLEESYLPELETRGVETRNLGLRSVWGAPLRSRDLPMRFDEIISTSCKLLCIMRIFLAALRVDLGERG